MRWGFHLPQLGRGASGEALRRFAAEAERLGVDSAWVSDHIAWPEEVASKYPYDAKGDFPAPFNIPWLDPLGTLAYVAAGTDRISLGTSVLILGYRPPVQTAKLIATLDALSGGRIILGVGVGWMKEEFDALQMPFDHRGARGDEQIEVFDALFGQEYPAYEGRFYRFPPLGFSPKPASGRVPIWIGGHTEAAFRRTARYGDGFHAAFQGLDEVAHEWAQVRAACEARRRDPAAIELSLRMFLDFDGQGDAVKSVQGGPDQMLETISRVREVGISHVVFDVLARGGVEGRLEAMQRFMTEVAPEARA